MTHNCNNAMLRRASRMLGQLYDDELAPSGLRATQHGLLAQIHIMHEPTLRDLAAEIVMDLSALGHSLKPLIRDGYVALVPDEKDGRVKHVTLTKAGQRSCNRRSASGRRPKTGSKKSLGTRRQPIFAPLSANCHRTRFARPTEREAPNCYPSLSSCCHARVGGHPVITGGARLPATAVTDARIIKLVLGLAKPDPSAGRRQ